MKNKKMMTLLLAASLAASSITGCNTSTREVKEVVLEEQLNKPEEEKKEVEELVKEQKPTPTEVVTPTPEVDPYLYNAILEEYDDGTKLVMINGEEIIITPDIALYYDEEGHAYLEQAPLDTPLWERGIERVFSLKANTPVNVRMSPSTDGEKIGSLGVDQVYEMTGLTEDGWYEIKYYDKTAYVKAEYVDEVVTFKFDSIFENTYYSTEDKTLTIPGYLRETCDDEEVIIPKGEFFEVYLDEGERGLLCKTSDYVGYIDSSSLVELTGTFVIVDISDQNLKLYKDGEIILNTPIVTGKPRTPTSTGIFSVFDKSFSRYLVGPTWKSYVDVMMKFNGGIGLHDAEYHKDDNGFKHGWREPLEFGGQTYLTDGSHGCVNMPHDAAMFTSEYVDVGTKVLVKK